jgi:hypothetical protein
MSYVRHARMHLHRRACADACQRCERELGRGRASTTSPT